MQKSSTVPWMYLFLSSHFSTFNHMKVWPTNATSASLYTVNVWRNQQRLVPLRDPGIFVHFQTMAHGTFSLYKENNFELILLKIIILCRQLMVTQTQRDPRLPFHCIHEECENNSFGKRIKDEEEPQKWKTQGVVWIQFCCVLLQIYFCGYRIKLSTALDKLWGMNFKGFNTAGSRETCQSAGNSPTVHSQKEEGTDWKPSALHSHFHHLLQASLPPVTYIF